MTDRHPVVSLKHQFDEVKRSIQSMRTAMKTPVMDYLTPEESRYEILRRASTDRPSSAELVRRFDPSQATRRTNTPMKSESTSSYSYVRTLEDDNADLRRRLAAAEADGAVLQHENLKLKVQIEALEAKAKNLENENANLKASSVRTLGHAASASAFQSPETPKRSSESPLPIGKAESLLSTPTKRPSSCIRSATSPPKKQRVAFNKNLKIAHFHSDDFRIFELPSHPLKDDRPTVRQPSYTERSAQSPPSRWASDGYRQSQSDTYERRNPYSVLRY